ncbi:retrovirus-related pol polyprotein from transposon TNT 1-94 [Tanacetum coccineum]
MVTDPPPANSTVMPAPRKKLDSEFNDEENKLEMADTQAEIILSQGLPRHMLQHTQSEHTERRFGIMWRCLCKDQVGLFNKGRKICLMSEYERFRAIGNESIHDYFVRFHKLVNDMKITQLEIPTHQMNTKFVNNLPAYWGKGSSSNVGNTGARGKKVICYNCRGEGHVARQCKEPKRKMDSQYFKDKALLMEAKEKGDVLDAEAEAFLADVECTAPYDQPQALTTTNMFQANHEDAYDSDVDEGPNAAIAFMANLSSTSAANSQVNEVHSNDNPNFDNVDYQLSQEMHQDEHLDSDAETEIDDNTIPYHQYLLDTEAQNVPTEVSADTSDKVSMIAILTDLQTQLDGHAKVNQEKCLEVETLKNELSQCKQEIYRLDTQKVKLDLEHKVRLD